MNLEKFISVDISAGTHVVTMLVHILHNISRLLVSLFWQLTNLISSYVDGYNGFRRSFKYSRSFSESNPPHLCQWPLESSPQGALPKKIKIDPVSVSKFLLDTFCENIICGLGRGNCPLITFTRKNGTRNSDYLSNKSPSKHIGPSFLQKTLYTPRE